MKIIKDRVKKLKFLKVPESIRLVIAVTTSEQVFDEFVAWLRVNTPKIQRARVADSKRIARHKERYKRLREAGYPSREANAIANLGTTNYLDALAKGVGSSIPSATEDDNG